MATRKRPRNNGSSSASASTIPRTTSLSDLAPPTRAPRGGGGSSARAPAGAGSGFGAAHRRHSVDSFPATTETAAFLKVCGYCDRGLGPGRDTFIYMGEVAFCSNECRQHQVNLDELMESKCVPPAGGGGGSDQSGKGSSTIAAA